MLKSLTGSGDERGCECAAVFGSSLQSGCGIGLMDWDGVKFFGLGFGRF